MRPHLLRFGLVALAGFVVVPSVLAEKQGQPFNVTCAVSFTYVGPDGTFFVSGTGTGTIGDFVLTGYVTIEANEGGERFVTGEITTMTEEGDLYLELFAHGGPTAEGSFRITGGSGVYAGASGAGAFKGVPISPDGSTQTGTFIGSLVVPVDAP